MAGMPGSGTLVTRRRCYVVSCEAVWRHSATVCAVAENIFIQNWLKVLPVPICGQAKPSSACLSAPCLPPSLFNPSVNFFRTRHRTAWNVSRDRRNVCPAARLLSLSPYAVNSNIRTAENQQTEPLDRHRRRNVRSPAATDRALWRARRKALLAPDCCRGYHQKCPGDR